MESLQLRLQEAESAVAVASQGLSAEARMVSRYAELKAIRDKAEEEMKDISKHLLAHYNETGERAGNGAQEVAITDRTTYEYDDARMREEMPTLYSMAVKVDGTKIAALLKAKAFTEEKVAPYRTAKTTQVLTIRAVKGDTQDA